MPWPQTLLIYIFCKNCVEPISRSGWVLPSAHAVWGGEGQDHQQVDHGQIITQPQRPLSIISAPQIYHTMVLSAVTHSLVIGCKMRQEDPTADTSMVTRPPHHTYTMLVAGLLQTQIQKLLWILQIFPYNSQQTHNAPWPTACHSVLVNVSMLEGIGLAVLLCIWVWKHVRDNLFVWLCAVWGHFL